MLFGNSKKQTLQTSSVLALQKIHPPFNGALRGALTLFHAAAGAALGHGDHAAGHPQHAAAGGVV